MVNAHMTAANRARRKHAARLPWRRQSERAPRLAVCRCMAARSIFLMGDAETSATDRRDGPAPIDHRQSTFFFADPPERGDAEIASSHIAS